MPCFYAPVDPHPQLFYSYGIEKVALEAVNGCNDGRFIGRLGALSGAAQVHYAQS